MKSITHGPVRARLLMMLLLCTAAFASEPGVFDRTLNVSGPITLDVRSDPGGVYITPGSSSSVIVHAIIKPLYGTVDFDIAEANIRALEKDPPIEQTGNQIRIGYPKNPALLRAVTIRYEIQTPRATEVRAHTESGGISIRGITGPADLTISSGRTEISDIEGKLTIVGHSGEVIVRDAGSDVLVRNSSGGLQLSNIRGNVVAETTSARIDINDVAGNVRSTTHSGGTRINNVKGNVEAFNQSGKIDALEIGGAVRAETTSGAIQISQVSPAPIRAITHSGAIKVELASQAGYSIDAKSESGKVVGRAIATFERTKKGNAAKGQIGPGGPLVDLDTHSAKIEID